jgi:DNA polymerase-3 subunit alpha
MTVLAYFVDRKVVRTIRNEIMSFGTFVDVHLDWIDTVHFPDSLKYYPLKGNGFYRITGKVVEEFGVHSIEVKSLLKVGYKQRSYKNL